MKVLIPIDGRACSHNCVRFIAQNFKRFTSIPEVTLFSVVEPLAPFVERRTSVNELDRFYTEESNRIQKRAQALLKKYGIAFKSAHDVTFPADGILSQLEREKYDLVILGSRGLDAVMGLFVGSVTTSVLANSKVPVLILRSAPSFEDRPIKIGIAVDGSEQSKSAVRFAVKHQNLVGDNSEFYLVSVVKDFVERFKQSRRMYLPNIDFFEADAVSDDDFKRALAPVRKDIKEFKNPPKEVKLVGDAIPEIKQFVATEGIDILVMGSHGRNRFDSVMIGSTVTQLSSKVKIPLLVIR